MMRQTTPGRWDWYAAILLVAIVYTAAVRLSVTSWMRELGYVESVAVLGAVLGLVVGISSFERRSAGWLICAYTIILVPWQLTRFITERVNAFERLAATGERLALTFGQLLAASRIEDPIFFVTLMSLLYWTIGVYCGYRLMRDRGLLTVLMLPTVPVLVVQYYDAYQVNGILIVAFYFFLVLLLIGRIHLLEKRSIWLSKRVFTGNRPESELITGILGMAAGVVILAWSFPTPAAALPAVARTWEQVSQPFETTRERINNILAAVEGNSRTSIEMYGNRMELGNTASQGPDQVFSVTPPGLSFPRYYWKMRVYDTYEKGNWRISTSSSERFTPGRADLSIPGSESAQAADFSFEWKTGTNILLAVPSQPVWVSRGGDFQFVGAGPGRVDVISWRVELALQPGDRYQARAILINPGVINLRSAGTNYPEWVRQYYLQMPDNSPQEIRNLAQNLTREQATPFDKANAVTEYLREEIEYNPSIPSPPSGVDPLEWFLFTWKRGFCNYYASAEVMLLRSIGIPARLAVGYAEGERQIDGTFIVRERDAHAWPEVYFPDIGWVAFEPTASQPDIDYSSGTDQNNGSVQPPGDESGNPTSERPEDDQSRQNGNIIATYQTIGVWVIISIIVLSLAGYGIWLSNRKKPLDRHIAQFLRSFYQHYSLTVPGWLQRWERWSDANIVERSFHAVNQSLFWLGKPQPPYASAAERAELLKKLLPSLAQDINMLKEQHEQTLFSPMPGNAAKAVRAAWRIRYLTIRTIIRRKLIVGAKNE
jgi:transglutaminase-like putative cysteine protease